MAQSTDQVTLGGGVLYTAPYGEAYPANPETAVAGNWEAMGYTDAGAVLSNSTTTAEARVDELFYPVVEVTTGITATLAATVAQFTFENLQRNLNGGEITINAGPPATRTFIPPGPAGIASFAALFRFTNDNGFNTDLHMPNVRNIADLSTTFQTSDAVIRQVPIELKMFPDSTITDAGGNEAPYQFVETTALS